MRHEYGIALSPLADFNACDALIVAVPYAEYLQSLDAIWPLTGPGGTFVDIKPAVDPARLPSGIRYMICATAMHPPRLRVARASIW